MKPKAHNLILDLDALEMAKGYDGLLRGHPEPVLIFAAFSIRGAEVLPLGRSVERFKPIRKDKFPLTVRPRRGWHLATQVRSSPSASFAILAMALEEDGNNDVQTLYGAVDNPLSLSMWPSNDHDPTPVHLHELTEDTRDWRYPTRVHLLIDGQDTTTTCQSDKWIGCVSWVLPTTTEYHQVQHRLHFQSADKLNDWTALLRVTRSVRS